MKRAEFLNMLTDLFQFRTIADKNGNSYILFRSSCLSGVDVDVDDKTAFEAVENHVHLLDNIKESEFSTLVAASQVLGQSLLNNLRYYYPDKQFYVFVSITLHDSLIIRFHQKWYSEAPYYDPLNFTNSKEVLLMFES